ncbi:class I mannose-6-phosphate isomerase [Flavobacteriaceae bacterium]|nr:class I mannose-6-phosphate isomerase [Flavobacteriaceae bacterium]MDB4773563.1 class I mannose-6-phosphate isomerase [Flavobacteriaceae bacterium]
MKHLYPLSFLPQFQYRLWGGEKLSTVLKKPYEGEKKGESWEISAVPGFDSEVANGPHKGKSLTELIDAFPKEIMGPSVLEKFGKTFPLLFKFIDAKIPLSVQVHPNDALAKERHNSYGKNEMWYVLDAEPNAELIIGFEKEIDQNSYQQLLEENRLEEVLHNEKVKAGDVVYIPTGRIHAIGGGVLLAEIQQSSDVTYRIYDFNRVDATTGEKRELHNDLALDALDFSVQTSHKVDYPKKVNHVNAVIETPYFSTSFLPIDGIMNRDYRSNNSFHILIGVGGSLAIAYAGEKYPLSYGNCLLIPAAIQQINIEGKGSCLEVFI